MITGMQMLQGVNLMVKNFMDAAYWLILQEQASSCHHFLYYIHVM
jgi:hypothetical protein